MYHIICLGLLLLALLILPPFGLLLAGNSLPPHLTLFPTPTQPSIASCSWPVWGILAALLGVTLAPVVCRIFQVTYTFKHEPTGATSFPWWGWVAVNCVALSWTLAWTRFDWFAPWQVHTFPLLWFGYVVLLNAFSYRRSGQCLLLHRPYFLGKLFLLSAGFWWTFEYLNQYVNNWHYVNLPESSHFKYLFYTSLSFSTVLPAVLSTYEWLATFPRLTRPFECWHVLPWSTKPRISWLLLSSGSVGMGLIGVWPTLLFPLLWLSPLCILLSVQSIRGKHGCWHGPSQGNWRPIILSALAALFCGFWWEFWNVYSLVHWEYTLPYVHAFKVFAMPVLGYAGYLPFGLTCLVVTELVLGYQSYTPIARWSEQKESMDHSHETPEV